MTSNVEFEKEGRAVRPLALAMLDGQIFRWSFHANSKGSAESRIRESIGLLRDSPLVLAELLLQIDAGVLQDFAVP